MQVTLGAGWMNNSQIRWYLNSSNPGFDHEQEAANELSGTASPLAYVDRR
jgi:hypothetical protein